MRMAGCCGVMIMKLNAFVVVWLVGARQVKVRQDSARHGTAGQVEARFLFVGVLK